jgi:hypothetical protein
MVCSQGRTIVMCRTLVVAMSFCAALLAGCAAQAPGQYANNRRCDAFAVSGGYPFLRGGPMGSNSTLEELPGAPPQWLGGPGEPAITQHLDEEDYLRRWCLANLQ